MGTGVTGLFCFDGPLYRDINGTYCSLTLTNEMFSRYFGVVDNLIVLVRTFPLNKTFVEANMNPLTLERIEVIEAPNLNSVKGFAFKWRFRNAIVKVLSRVTYIFARMPSVLSNEVLRLASKTKRSFLVEVGGCAWDSYWNHGLLGKIVAPIMFFNERRYVFKADFATYVTKSFLQERYPNKRPYNTINCSNVYLKEHDEAVLKNRIEKIRKMDLSRLIIGQAVNSTDVKYKGEQFVIKALPRLRKAGIHVEFQIVGPGSSSYLKKVAAKYGVSDQVVFLGALSKEQLSDWYQSIDLYAQPSLQEGLPRSVIEAMGFGCPCIGSNLAGIPELLDESCLFRTKSVKSVYETILSKNNKDELLRMSKCVFRASKEYSISIIENRRCNYFEKYKKHVINAL